MQYKTSNTLKEAAINLSHIQLHFQVGVQAYLDVKIILL